MAPSLGRLCCTIGLPHTWDSSEELWENDWPMNQSNTIHQLCLQIKCSTRSPEAVQQAACESVGSFVERLFLATGITVDRLCITLLTVTWGGRSSPVTSEEHSGAAQAEVEQLKLLLVLLQAGHGERQRLLQLVVAAAARLPLLLNLGSVGCVRRFTKRRLAKETN